MHERGQGVVIIGPVCGNLNCGAENNQKKPSPAKKGCSLCKPCCIKRGIFCQPHKTRPTSQPPTPLLPQYSTPLLQASTPVISQPATSFPILPLIPVPTQVPIPVTHQVPEVDYISYLCRLVRPTVRILHHCKSANALLMKYNKLIAPYPLVLHSPSVEIEQLQGKTTLIKITVEYIPASQSMYADVKWGKILVEEFKTSIPRSEDSVAYRHQLKNKWAIKVLKMCFNEQQIPNRQLCDLVDARVRAVFDLFPTIKEENEELDDPEESFGYYEEEEEEEEGTKETDSSYSSKSGTHSERSHVKSTNQCIICCTSRTLLVSHPLIPLAGICAKSCSGNFLYKSLPHPPSESVPLRAIFEVNGYCIVCGAGAEQGAVEAACKSSMMAINNLVNVRHTYCNICLNTLFHYSGGTMRYKTFPCVLCNPDVIPLQYNYKRREVRLRLVDDFKSTYQTIWEFVQQYLLLSACTEDNVWQLLPETAPLAPFVSLDCNKM